jgi:hypothetical protein
MPTSPPKLPEPGALFIQGDVKYDEPLHEEILSSYDWEGSEIQAATIRYAVEFLGLTKEQATALYVRRS